MLRFFVELLVIALVLLGAVPLAQMWVVDPGYVLIRYHSGVSIETNLFALMLAVLVAGLVMHWLIWLVMRLVAGPAALHRRQKRVRIDKGRDDLIEGLAQLGEGDWDKAERALSRSVERAEQPGLSLAAAARAAERLGINWRRDAYLRRARQLPQRQRVIARIAEAEMCMERGEYEVARDMLQELYRTEPYHPHILRLLALCHRELTDWRALLKLLPDMLRTKALPQEEFRALQRHIYAIILDQLSEQGKVEEVTRFWREAVSTKLRRDEALVIAHAHALARCGKCEEAEQEIVRLLQNKWSEAAVQAYGQFEGGDVASRLTRAESWRQSRGNSPALMSCLAELSLRCNRFEQARDYIQQSLQTAPSVQRYRLLGQILEKLEDWNGASQAYRHGLDFEAAT